MKTKNLHKNSSTNIYYTKILHSIFIYLHFIIFYNLKFSFSNSKVFACENNNYSIYDNEQLKDLRDLEDQWINCFLNIKNLNKDSDEYKREEKKRDDIYDEIQKEMVKRIVRPVCMS